MFTYEYGGALQTLRVTHRVMDGDEYEHLEYLNGPSRRIERSGRSTECLSPADQVMRGLFPALEGDYHGLGQHYRFYIRDEERIAGRAANVLQIVPRDDYRYGYTLSIDKETFLPLASMTFNANRQVLERLQFADIDLISDDSWVDVVGPTTDVNRSVWRACDRESDDMEWRVAWVPSGFVSAGNYRMQDVGEVQLFTDGLSAFSVFLSPMTKEVAAQGKAQRGATVAYMQQHMLNSAPYTVTVVGEIPARTAQRIANSLHWGPALTGETPDAGKVPESGPAR
ncbi:sigma factor AlgU regulator MucB [Pseudomaricurvus hydrocarbonicus]